MDLNSHDKIDACLETLGVIKFNRQSKIFKFVNITDAI